MRAVVATLLAAAILAPAAAAAQARCPAPEGASATTAELDGETRLRFLETSLARGARKARIWNWSWIIGYGALAGGQVAIGLVIDDEGRKKDLFVSAARAGIAGLAVLLLPLKAPREWRAYRSLNLPEPKLIEAKTCGEVAAAERALASAAASEARGKSWKKHLAVFGLNIVTGLVLWLGFDRPLGQAAITTGSGLAVGELMILTQPTASRDAWNRYRRGDLGAPAPRVSWTVTPFAGGGGLAIIGEF